MRIYFYDSNFRYIGSRLLEDGEEIPSNATTVKAHVGDGQEAYFKDGKWVVNVIIEPSINAEV